MPKCKNDNTRSYKGTEPSPKGLGYCAHPEKIGKKRKGKDGNMWIIKSTSKGILRWVKYKDNKKKDKNIFSELNKRQIDIINILKTDIKKELKKIDVKLIFKKLKKINGYYILDYVYPEDYDIDNDKFIIVVLKLDDTNKLYIPKKELNLQHINIKYKTKKDTINIFNKYLKNNFKWSGKQKDTINIKL